MLVGSLSLVGRKSHFSATLLDLSRETSAGLTQSHTLHVIRKSRILQGTRINVGRKPITNTVLVHNFEATPDKLSKDNIRFYAIIFSKNTE